MPTPRQPRTASRSTITSMVLPNPIARRAVVVGAGSFGTAIAVPLARGGLRTTLQTRTEEQAESLRETRENARYLPGVELPQELRVETVEAGLSRAELVFLPVAIGKGRVVGDIDEALRRHQLADGGEHGEPANAGIENEDRLAPGLAAHCRLPPLDA